MWGLFYGTAAFNQLLEDWDVSSVNNMKMMFSGAHDYNQPLNGWKDRVANVRNMNRMFMSAESFNQPLNNRNVSSVTNMIEMFRNAALF